MRIATILAFFLLIFIINGCWEGCNTCTSAQCLSCAIGYHMDNSFCYPCYSTCSRCTNNGSNSCYICNSGYYLSGGSCLSCPSHCSSCFYSSSSGYWCTSCENGYSMFSSQCIPNTNTSSNTSYATNVTIILIIVGVIVVMVITCICVYRCIKRRGQLIAAQQMPPSMPAAIYAVPAPIYGMPAPMYAPVNLSFIALIYGEKIQWKLDGERIDVLDDCVICQSSPGNSIISCKHVYHPRCISDWLARNKTCPMCRKAVDNMVTVICKSCHKSTLYKPLVEVVNLRDEEIQCCSFCLGG